MSVEAYLDAKNVYDEVDRRITELATMLGRASNWLKSDRRRFSFTNTIGLPSGAVLSQNNPSVNAKDWMSADDIQRLLADWHDAREKMFIAWKIIPAEKQRNLVSPPDRGNMSREY